MMNLTEKAAYLKGLAEGLKVNADDDMGKLVLALIDTIDDIALTVADLEDELAETRDYIEEIDEDLGAVEEDLYDDEDDDDCDCCCGDDDFYEVECPACHETICLDEDMLCEGEIECPNCGTDLEFDFDDECDCCCDCCDEGEEE
ncbi:MAG: hypothetical protein UHZ05_00075 [Acutalibacteraceae bacterium]|nr:hypothetical protein [Acutalibacteraceae bacterium]